MAVTLWGRVYFDNRYAGLLQQEPGERYAFTYDSSYIAAGGPALSLTLPLQAGPCWSEGGLHPFFDNLVAEGWLRSAQARALGVRPDERFALLLAFGQDCAGAVSVIDPAPTRELAFGSEDAHSLAALSARASLSGIQPKLTVVKGPRGYRPSRANELSTHIAKLPSGPLPDIIALEWLTTEATRRLLPDDAIATMEIAEIENLTGAALLIHRFDRTLEGGRLHFEEFNQLLGNRSEDKYQGHYEDMARLIRATPGCIPAEVDRLYRRVLACLLVGNTDAHLKNFAMLHTDAGLRLAPCYDLVASAFYPQFNTIALGLAKGRNMRLGALQARHIVALGEGFGLPHGAIGLAVEDLGRRMEAAITVINEARIGPVALRDRLIDLMERRWNGTFASTGPLLSKRRTGGGRRKSSPSDGSPPSPT